MDSVVMAESGSVLGPLQWLVLFHLQLLGQRGVTALGGHLVPLGFLVDLGQEVVSVRIEEL